MISTLYCRPSAVETTFLKILFYDDFLFLFLYISENEAFRTCPTTDIRMYLKKVFIFESGLDLKIF